MRLDLLNQLENSVHRRTLWKMIRRWQHLVFFFRITRKSSYVNARGIPSAAQQVFHFCCPILRGVLHSWRGGVPRPICGALPSDLSGVPPSWPDWDTPPGRDLRPVTGVPLHWKGHGTSGSIMGRRWGTPSPGVNWPTNWNYYLPHPQLYWDIYAPFMKSHLIFKTNVFDQ